MKEHRYSLSTLTCCPEFFYAEVKEAWTQGYYNFSRNDAASLPRWTSQLRFQSLFMCSAQFSLTLMLAPKTFSRSYFLSCSAIVLIYMWHLSAVLSSSVTHLKFLLSYSLCAIILQTAFALQFLCVQNTQGSTSSTPSEGQPDSLWWPKTVTNASL